MNIRKIPVLGKKSILYIKRFGIKSFVMKVYTYTKSRFQRSRDNISYSKFLKLEKFDVKKMKKEISEFKYNPLVSFVIPTYNTPPNFLFEAIESVKSQVYTNWEVIIYDDGSSSKSTTAALHNIKDQNIKVYFGNKNGGISKATNLGVLKAKGEFIAFLDHDDTISPDALFEVVKALNKNRNIDYIYSDEDKLNERGERVDPFFKPDFSLYLLLTCMYITHFRVVRKSFFKKIGGYKSIYDGAQDWDFALRLYSMGGNIFHIPKILYHWRMSPTSTAQSNSGAKNYALVRQKNLITDFLKRNNIKGSVIEGFWQGSWKVFFSIINNPSVEIIIPIKDNVVYLKKCISSIIKKSTYTNYHITIVNNNSEKSETLKYLKKISQDPKVKVVAYNKKFNYSRVNNIGVKASSSDYLLFLNSDTEVITPGWIEEMLSLAQRKDVGAVGPLLLYKDETVQHAGVIVGLGGVAGHSHRGFLYPSNGHGGAITSIRNYSAVTAACLLVSRDKFQQVGGFDEEYNVVYSDVDICLKLNEKGYGTVYTPYARLFHYESKTRGKQKYENDHDIDIFIKRWKNLIENGDPYYNCNLTLSREDFSFRKV